MPYQSETLSKRRPRLAYSDVVTAEAPAARQRYFQQQSYGLSKERLAQEQAQFDKEMAFAQKQAKEQKKQAERARHTSAAGMGLTVGIATGNPLLGVAAFAVGEMSLICGAINRRHPDLIPKDEMRLMLKLREWILEVYPTWVKFYEEACPIALGNMIDIIGQEKYDETLNELHTKLFSEIPVLIKINDMYGAFKAYKKVALDFILTWAPEFTQAADYAIKVESRLDKLQMPEAQNV